MNGENGQPPQPESAHDPDPNAAGQPDLPEPNPPEQTVTHSDTGEAAHENTAVPPDAPSDDPPTQPGGNALQALVRSRWGWLLPAALFIAMIAATIWLIDTLTYSWQTAVTQRQITLVSDPLQPVILHNGVYMDTPFALADGSAFFVGSLDPNTPASLISLALATGSVNWSAEAEPWQFPVAVPGILFIEEATGVAGSVKALSTISGAEIWVRDFRLLGGNNINYLAAIDDNLSVRLHDDLFNSYYLIGQSDGRTIQQKRTDAENVFYIDRDPLRVYEALPGSVRVSSRAGWQAEVPGFNLQPQIHGNIILVQYTPYDSAQDALMALDRQSGAVLWQRPDPISSNTAVVTPTGSQPIAFTLAEREGGTQLLAIDLASGDMLGSILFTAAPTDEFSTFVASDGQQVAVYFGDARQLFVFNWQPG